VDFLRLSGESCGVAIGDVAGKGLGAALFMVKIQATLSAIATEYPSLRDLASKLNRILIRDGMPGKFASLIFVRIDSPAGVLRYVNAVISLPFWFHRMVWNNSPRGMSPWDFPPTRVRCHEIALSAARRWSSFQTGSRKLKTRRASFTDWNG